MILRAWHSAGTRIERSPLGGFEEWSQRIRAPLLWLGCDDPCETTLRVKADDPQVERLTAVLRQWRECIGVGIGMTMREISNKADLTPDFRNALLDVAAAPGTGTVLSMKRLGGWLRQLEGRIVNGVALRRMTDNVRDNLWSLRQS
jgi:putative DNA primase/helicase